MSLKLFLDEDINPAVAKGLRKVGIDAVSVHEVGRANRAISDEDQLTFSAADGRTLVTYNRSDYQALDAIWHLHGREHCGIFWCTERIIPRRAVGDLILALQYLAEQHSTLVGLCLPVTSPTR